MKRHWTILFGIVAAIAATTAVQAIPISGTISMGGEGNFDSTDLSAATTVSSWDLVYVISDSGAFGSIGDYSIVNMSSSAWIFAPAPGTALPNLWNVGGFQFDFTSDSITSSSTFLDITGYGTITDNNAGNNYDPTEFEWSLEAEYPATGGPAQITFSATAEPGSNTVPVPDGGPTVALLGVALAGIEVLRRKLTKALEVRRS